MEPKSEIFLDITTDYKGIGLRKKFNKGGILKVAGKLKKKPQKLMHHKQKH